MVTALERVFIVARVLRSLPAELHNIGDSSRWSHGGEGMRGRKEGKSISSSIHVKLKINQFRHQWVTD